MRILFFIFIFITSLYAKELQSCYTIQLISVQNSTKNTNILEKQKYPQECIRMNIGDKTTLRCGCYKEFKTAQQKLPHYKEKYKQAYIATSYKFRFKSKPKQTKEKDEELKLMLQTFLYSNDLNDAYKTAKIGYKKNPQSYYWNQKMAEMSEWTGRGQEAIKYLKFMYYKTYNQKIEKKIIDYELKNYHYESIKGFVTNEAKTKPTKANIERMIYLYSKLGEPQEAAQILHNIYKKHPKEKNLLTQELQIYMNMGDLQSAQKSIQKIENEKLFSPANVKLISYYYYLKGKIQKSYNVLKKVDYTKAYDKKLYQLSSDLGWYLQDYLPAAKASKILIEKNDGRLVDYERVIYANQQNNYNLAMHTALKAYHKFHLSYLFYTFAQNAIKYKKFTLLDQTIDTIDANHNSITKETNYWLVKTEVYKHFNKRKEALHAIQTALKLANNNMLVSFSAIDLYLKFNLYNKASALLTNIIRHNDLSPAFYYVLASLYNTLHNINRASYYVNLLLRKKATVTKTIEFKFLQADLYRAQNKQNASIKKIKEIIALLDKKAINNPNVLTDKYLNNYLRAQFYVMPADDFQRILEVAKKYLTKAHYDDIHYAWATKNNAKDEAHKIYLQTDNKAMWLQLSNALAEQNHSKIEDLLFLYLAALPKDDAAYAAQNDGQISLAQSRYYNSLNTNRYNQTAYISMLNITKKRSDLISTKLSYYNRNPLQQKYINIKNSLYIARNLYFLSDFDYYLNSSIDTNTLVTTPGTTLSFKLGLKKLFDRGNISMHYGYANSMRSYPFFSATGEYLLKRYITLKASLAKNIKADESTQLLLGGKKDMLSLGVLYQILDSTSLEVTYKRNLYTSQDNVNIGNSHYISTTLSHQIRNGYPDMRVGLFSDYAIYHENSGSKGVINELQNGTFNVLPSNFYNIGADFSYGMQNSHIYTRVWRPYFELSSYYNSELQALSYGFSGGYGGKIYTQDHLVLSAKYTSDVNGIGGSIFEIFLRYEFLYTH